MARYLVFHKLPDAATQNELVAAGQVMRATQCDGARWLRGWVSPENDRFVGEWEASEGEAVQAALEEVALLPVETIRLVVAVDPEWFGEPDGSANVSG
jgi:hypothetical protein